MKKVAFIMLAALFIAGCTNSVEKNGGFGTDNVTSVQEQNKFDISALGFDPKKMPSQLRNNAAYLDTVSRVRISYPCSQNYRDISLDQSVRIELTADSPGFAFESYMLVREIPISIYKVPVIFFEANKDMTGCKPIAKEKLVGLTDRFDSKAQISFFLAEPAVLELPIEEAGTYYVELALNNRDYPAQEIGVFLNVAEPEMEEYVNETDRYSFQLPKSWGAIEPFGSKYVENLYSGWETMGPFIPPDWPTDYSRYYVDFTLWSDANAYRPAGSSWIEQYKTSAHIDENNTFTELTGKYPMYEHTSFDEETGEYLRTCRLIEGNDRLYSLCFHKDDPSHRKIIHSFKIL